MRVRFSRNGLSPERARSTRSWVGAALGCACILGGCTRTTVVTEHAAPSRGVRAINTVPPIAVPVSGRSEDNADGLGARHDSVASGQSARVEPSDTALPLPSTEPSTPPLEPKVRDYPAELARLVGDPSSCLEPRVGDGTQQPIQIVIRSQVMPSGAVTRADVSSAALRSGEQRCIAHRVESAHFAPPIEGAPMAVESSIWLRPTAPVPAPRLAAAPIAPSAEGSGIPQPLAAASPVVPSTEDVALQPSAAEPTPPTENVATAVVVPPHEDGTAPAD
jgi:hypothetical protein